MMICRSEIFDPVKSWLVMAGMEFMVWRSVDGRLIQEYIDKQKRPKQ